MEELDEKIAKLNEVNSKHKEVEEQLEKLSQEFDVLYDQVIKHTAWDHEQQKYVRRDKPKPLFEDSFILFMSHYD